MALGPCTPLLVLAWSHLAHWDEASSVPSSRLLTPLAPGHERTSCFSRELAALSSQQGSQKWPIHLPGAKKLATPSLLTQRMGLRKLWKSQELPLQFTEGN